MSNIAEEFEVDGLTVKIYWDEEPRNPREWDEFGHMVYWHRNYSLGDEQPKESPEEWREQLANEIDPTVLDRLNPWKLLARPEVTMPNCSARFGMKALIPASKRL